MLHSGDVERRPPAALVVLRELNVLALMVHPGDDVTDARPAREPRLKGAEWGAAAFDKRESESR